MDGRIPRRRPIATRMRWGRRHPWAQSLVVLSLVTSGALTLDRVFRPDDPVQNVLLAAFVGGTIAAVVIAQPLGHVPYLARNLDAGPDLDTFLACGVVAWLGIRFALGVNGNPQVGGAGLHIAHMLWGGAFMLTGTVIGLLYLGRYRQRLVAAISGLGFGLFIDELGKFITSNNDYFYRPAVALVYATFVALYLLFRTLRQERHVTDRESLVNALDWLKEAVIRDHDPRALDRARFYLERVQTRGADSEALDGLLDDLQRMGSLPPLSRHERLRRAGVKVYERTMQSAWFERVAIGFVLLLVALQVFADIQEARSLFGVGPAYRIPGSHQTLTFYNAVGTIIEGLAGGIGDILLLAGAVAIFQSRSLAFRLWKLGIQIIMFVAGVISLYYFQFLALPELGIDAVALVLVNSLILGERRCTAIELHRVERSSRALDGSAGHSVSVR